MRILVISLLRLGDIFIASPAIHGLRQKYPNAKIDLLVNQNFLSVHSLISDVDSVIGFDRRGLQDGLAEASCPLIEPVDYLSEIIDELRSANYDMVVNLTQNKLSGFLTSLLDAKSQLGLSISSKGQATYSSSWFRYLNDYVAAGADNVFHYTDIFCYGTGLPSGMNKFNFTEGPAGKDEVANFFNRVGYSAGPKIIVQALTSDAKKNLSRKKWVEALAQLQTLEPSAHIFLLGAPDEKNELIGIHQELRLKNIRNDIAIMSLDGALSLLGVCDLLITGDTSIKHLACGTTIPILEISIGSSDYRKTGVHKTGSLILKTNEACSPCGHALACHRDSHLCAERLPSELIALSASKYLHKDWAALKILAEEYSDCAELIKTDWAKFGLWQAQKLFQLGSQIGISEQLDRAAWKFLLEREHLKPLAAYGSESLKIKENIELNSDPEYHLKLKFSLQQIEDSTRATESRLNKILASLSKQTRLPGELDNVDFVNEQLKREIINIEKVLGFGRVFSHKIESNVNTGLYQIRQLQNSLNEAFSQQQIKLKLIRSLRNHIMEGI